MVRFLFANAFSGFKLFVVLIFARLILLWTGLAVTIPVIDPIFLAMKDIVVKHAQHGYFF